VNCYALFKSRGFSLAFVIAHVCYLQRKSVFVRPSGCQTQIFSAVTGLWGSGKVSLLASKKNF